MFLWLVTGSKLDSVLDIDIKKADSFCQPFHIGLFKPWATIKVLFLWQGNSRHTLSSHQWFYTPLL